MLSLDQIQQHYSENIKPFLGGTALRIIYNNSRFSEDLDFDNFGLSEKDFSRLSREIKKGLTRQGYKIEIKNVFKGAYRCYVRMPKVLFNNKISDLQKEKIMIQIDSASHDFKYRADKKILNKFDIFTQILVTPVDIILAQKIYAIFNRKRPKGRDFFDVVFLLQNTRPNYRYLNQKLKIADAKTLKKRLLRYSEKIKFNALIKDVEPFLFNAGEINRIKFFKQYIEEIELDAL
ncbi:MAG: nucleotidyl transferase AbiEii/AbiGii toxin family protein [Patescibacteria group bacterium]|nr:nucleotidyl transferase AbiEii/AbiGii toxin family protein [Patescibacteria group bacterium]